MEGTQGVECNLEPRTFIRGLPTRGRFGARRSALSEGQKSPKAWPMESSTTNNGGQGNVLTEPKVRTSARKVLQKSLLIEVGGRSQETSSHRGAIGLRYQDDPVLVQKTVWLQPSAIKRSQDPVAFCHFATESKHGDASL